MQWLELKKMLNRGRCVGNGRLLRVGLAWIALLLAIGSSPLLAAERVALVIGNSAYTVVPHLRNPGNDARDMAARLRRLGFR